MINRARAFGGSLRATGVDEPEQRLLVALCRALIGTVTLLIVIPCVATEIVRNPTKETGAGPLFQIHYGKKWGYMDRSGKAAISPRFDDEGDFFGGLARVEMGQKWGYVDEKGRLAIPCQFDNAGDFREGLAPVQLNRRWGFIDSTGRLVIKPQFQAAAEFRDGLARFEMWDTVQCDPPLYTKENPSEHYTKENAPLYAFRLHLTKNLAVGMCFSPNALYGFVDKRGNLTIAAKFPMAQDFSEGLAPVRLERSSKSKWGYIDKAGRIVIEPQFDQVSSFSEGLAAVETGFRADGSQKVAGEWGFVSRDGTFAIPPRFDQVLDFSEGLAGVLSKDGDWGYINKQGAFVIPPKFGVAGSFSDGLSLVSPCDEVGDCFIDKTGKIALVLKLPGPQWPFSDGLAVAGDPGQRKYTDHKGRIVASYEIDPAPLVKPGNRPEARR